MSSALHRRNITKLQANPIDTRSERDAANRALETARLPAQHTERSRRPGRQMHRVRDQQVLMCRKEWTAEALSGSADRATACLHPCLARIRPSCSECPIGRPQGACGLILRRRPVQRGTDLDHYSDPSHTPVDRSGNVSRPHPCNTTSGVPA